MIANRAFLVPFSNITSFSVRNFRFIRALDLVDKKTGSFNQRHLRYLKRCKFINEFQTIGTETPINWQHLKLYLKMLGKILKNLQSQTYSHQYISRRPSKFTIDMSDFRDWKIFFKKRGIRRLKLFNNDSPHHTAPKMIPSIVNKMKRSSRSFEKIKTIAIEGLILNEFCRPIITYLMNIWGKVVSAGCVEVRIWDNKDEKEFLPNNDILHGRIHELYLSHAFHDCPIITRTIFESKQFRNLQKLECHAKLNQTNNFKPFLTLDSLLSISELRCRFELEGQLAETSRKFLYYFKFPPNVSNLSLIVGGLRLKWVTRAREVMTIEETYEDEICEIFLKGIENMRCLDIVFLSFNDLKMKYSSFLLSIFSKMKNATTVFTTWSNRNFDWSQSKKYPVLDFGVWMQKLADFLYKLKMLSIDFPVLYLNNVPQEKPIFGPLEMLSLGYRINDSGNNLKILLSILPINHLKGLFLGDSKVSNRIDLVQKWKLVSNFTNLENLSLAFNLNFSINDQAFDEIKILTRAFKELVRLTIRYEKGNIEKENWRNELRSEFLLKKKIISAVIVTKNEKFSFVK